MNNFSDFGLAKPIIVALAEEGHTTPTPIQSGAIPPLMLGCDLLGIAQTGTGKTAAFALPILHRLAATRRETRPGACRALVLAPTRELAGQVHDRFAAYGRGLGLSTGLIIGGASITAQRAMARRGVDIVVATPGRLIDILQQGALSLSLVEAFVIDEVDQMLDLGFLPAIRKIGSNLPGKRQSIFFSATVPPAIARLADTLLKEPTRIEIRPTAKLKIEESVIFIENAAKPSALLDIVKRDDFTRGLVFARTKHGADGIVRKLTAGGAPAYAIHGNRSQSQRVRALNAFRAGEARILVATDIAARGLDIADVSHVINYDLPNVAETYVHRIGRTGRAGAAGVAISFCSADERQHLRAIERLTHNRITTAQNSLARPSSGTGKSGPSPSNERRPDRSAEPHFASMLFMKDPLSTPDDTRGTARRTQPMRDEHGQRRTARVRRRRNRSAAGRELSGSAG